MAQDFAPSVFGPSAAQVRAGRGLLGWTQERLASAAHLPVATLQRFEAEAGPIPPPAVDALCRALEAEGVIFLDAAAEGPGVRLSRRAGFLDQGLRPQELTAENDG